MGEKEREQDLICLRSLKDWICWVFESAQTELRLIGA